MYWSNSSITPQLMRSSKIQVNRNKAPCDETERRSEGMQAKEESKSQANANAVGKGAKKKKA
ncbi:hypothetical protein CCACVL1_02356 [Corchorus capsularis]|uniref:Uncharacterized protein n=1 Tax=Corchorus capsularis TaxID=210143 RepID=A0A1R3K965_COCAP|nr:hypothetical protein CCACVL1_02356 [Corchorus capsularis]